MNTAESSKPRIVIVGRGVAGLLAKGDTSIFALGDCASCIARRLGSHPHDGYKHDAGAAADEECYSDPP